MRIRRYCWIVLVFFFVLPPFSFSGEVYRWTDERGTVHFTDDLSNIPEQYLDQVIKGKSPEEPSKKDEKKDKTEKEKPKKDESQDRVKKYLKDIDKKIEEKKKLEKRISKLEEELKPAEARLKEIEEKEKEYFNYHRSSKGSKKGKYSSAGSPYTAEKKKLETKIKDIKKELGPLREKVSKINRSL
jgi:chromosome segregation ATPase